MNKQEVTSDKFYYNIKHKYECFANIKFHPQPILVDDEVLECLDIGNDYEIELCLKNYEAAVGKELVLSVENPADLYYGRKRKPLTAEEEKQKVES